MLFEFPESGLTLGTYMPAHGDSRPLSAGDFTVQPQSHWTSGRTGATYPTSWTVQVNSAKLAVTIAADANDQEIDARFTTLIVYWKGLSAVNGLLDGQAIDRVACVEMAKCAR